MSIRIFDLTISNVKKLEYICNLHNVKLSIGCAYEDDIRDVMIADASKIEISARNNAIKFKIDEVGKCSSIRFLTSDFSEVLII